jgi:hypothetical protein
MAAAARTVRRRGDGGSVIYPVAMIHRFLVLVLVGAVLALVPVAHASPPDQTWIAGLYDNADYDDVVIALTSTVATSDGASTPSVGPAAEVVVTLRPSEPTPPPSAPLVPYHLRAPPLA